MSKKLSILLIGVIALLLSCSDKKIESDLSSTKTKANLHVSVADQNNSKLLAAKVTLRVTGESKTIAPPKPAEFTGISSSKQPLLVEMQGYASKAVNVGVEPGTAYISRDKDTLVFLPKLASSLEGFLFYTNDKGQNVPMKDAKVRIILNDTTLTKRNYEATVGADGKYSFENLPSVANAYDIWFIGAEANPEFGIAVNPITVPSLVEDITAKANKYDYNMAYAQQNVPFTVLNYKKEFQYEELNEPVVFKFSGKIDRSKGIANNVVTVYDVATWTPNKIPTNISWTDDELIVSPIGKWTENFLVCANGLYSVLGQYFSECSDEIAVFQKNISLVKVDGLELAKPLYHNDIDVLAELHWNKVEGAKEYIVYAYVKDKVYSRPNLDDIVSSDYEAITCNPSTIDTTTAICPVNYLGKNQFIVQAVNASGVKSIWSNPLDVDNTILIKPNYDMDVNKTQKLSGDSVIYFRDYNYTNGFYNPSQYINYLYNYYGYYLSYYLGHSSYGMVGNEGVVYFNREMDTDVSLTSGCKAETDPPTTDPCAKLELVGFTWHGSQTLSFSVRATNAAALPGDMNVNAVLSIVGLKGANGAEFETVYSDGLLTPVTKNTVDIRFTVEGNPCGENGLYSLECETWCRASFANFTKDYSGYSNYCSDNTNYSRCDFFPNAPGCAAWCLDNEGASGTINENGYYYKVPSSANITNIYGDVISAYGSYSYTCPYYSASGCYNLGEVGYLNTSAGNLGNSCRLNREFDFCDVFTNSSLCIDNLMGAQCATGTQGLKETDCLCDSYGTLPECQ